MISIEEGIQIDSSDEQYENADSPSSEIWQPRSNVNVERCLQQVKQDFEMTSMDEGIQID
jgi:hypothetical protein